MLHKYRRNENISNPIGNKLIQYFSILKTCFVPSLTCIFSSIIIVSNSMLLACGLAYLITLSLSSLITLRRMVLAGDDPYQKLDQNNTKC